MHEFQVFSYSFFFINKKTTYVSISEQHKKVQTLWQQQNKKKNPKIIKTKEEEQKVNTFMLLSKILCFHPIVPPSCRYLNTAGAAKLLLEG